MSKVVGIGPHYKSLLKVKGIELDDNPFLFIKPMSTMIKTDDKIVIPKNVEKVCSEVEIAIKLNRTVKNVSVEEVQDLSIIDGYAICNDITAFGDGLFGNGKLYDSFTPIGDFVSIDDPTNIQIESYCNGELKQSAYASDMGHSFSFIISYFSRFMTLEKGDILLTGTPATPFEMKAGDVVDLRSPQLGTVSNSVIAE